MPLHTITSHITVSLNGMGPLIVQTIKTSIWPILHWVISMQPEVPVLPGRLSFFCSNYQRSVQAIKVQTIKGLL